MSSSVTASPADAGADVLGKRAVDVHLAGNRDAHAGQAAVDIARHKAELRLECRPALVCNGDILARAAGCASTQSSSVSSYCASCGRMLGHHCCPRRARFPCLRRPSGCADRPRAHCNASSRSSSEFSCNLNAEVVQRLDGRVAGEEVQRARAEGDDLEAASGRQHRSRNRHELAIMSAHSSAVPTGYSGM